ncbi:MAG TPA: M36 family metallopeptidase, partial [Polyangiales bacterium]|nr:M36 family metallopeptidase [Polyangiales bacterium]
KNAQAAGALAILILDNTPGHTPTSPGVDDPSIAIPLLSLSYEDGQKLKSALASGAVSATTFTRGTETLRDGTIDNSVIAHEWGHYLHHRLVQCGSQQCDGMSEGWADFNALLMVIRDGDTFPGKVYPLAQYASGGLSANATYFGIRRAPYSVEMDKNPFTFQDIRQMATLPTTAPLLPADPDPSEVHNVGEIWAETLFEGYANLLTSGYAAGRSFDESKRRMADYVVAGMKAAPTEPSFVEQRDAILASVYAMAASDPSRLDDFTALAQGFAKRGLGVGAIAPPTDSQTLDEAVENFDFKGAVALSDASFDDSVSSCDHDGKLDAGESGKLTFTVMNNGWLPLTSTSVHVQSSAALTFDGGGTVQVGTLEPFGATQVSIGVTAAAGAHNESALKLTVGANDPEAYATSISSAFELLYNYDDVAASAASDDVESEHTAWVVSPDTLASVWSREGDALNRVWHSDDVGVQSDESLVSPDLVVSASGSLVISFKQRYSFEAGPISDGGPDVDFDGGVLEVSLDGGTTWQDISKYGNPGYTATLFTVGATQDAGLDGDTNALAGRKAWGGESPNYPSYTTTSIKLGTRLAGKTIKLRFRMGSDDSGGAAGWDIDNISFGSGISNTPFGAIENNAISCE